MKEPASSRRSGGSGTLKRRSLLCAAVAAGGAIITAKADTGAMPGQRILIADPQLRAAMLKYGGEFGGFGKEGSDGDL